MGLNTYEYDLFSNYDLFRNKKWYNTNDTIQISYRIRLNYRNTWNNTEFPTAFSRGFKNTGYGWWYLEEIIEKYELQESKNIMIL